MLDEKWRAIEKKVAALKRDLRSVGYPMVQPLANAFPEIEKMILDSEIAFASVPDLGPEIIDLVAKQLEGIDKAIQAQIVAIYYLPGGFTDMLIWRQEAESLQNIVKALYEMAQSLRP